MHGLPHGFSIERATLQDIPSMIWADKAASTLFEPTGLIHGDGLSDHVPADIFEKEIVSGGVFVARRLDGHSVGFALSRQRGKGFYLDQVSVHPDYGQKGLGRALVLQAIFETEERRLPHLTLSTFRDIPWNGPFYKSLGFAELPRSKFEPFMFDIEEAQRPYMDVAKRCFMRRRVRRALFRVRQSA